MIMQAISVLDDSQRHQLLTILREKKPNLSESESLSHFGA